MEEQGGLITAADLAGYRPRWLEPVTTTYRSHTICAAPPPNHGTQILECLVRRHPGPGSRTRVAADQRDLIQSTLFPFYYRCTISVFHPQAVRSMVGPDFASWLNILTVNPY
jgi:hypothetical protein